jgi:hypothetical protein
MSDSLRQELLAILVGRVRRHYGLRDANKLQRGEACAAL